MLTERLIFEGYDKYWIKMSFSLVLEIKGLKRRKSSAATLFSTRTGFKTIQYTEKFSFFLKVETSWLHLSSIV